MEYTLPEIAVCAGGKLIIGDTISVIDHIVFDSRKLIVPHKSVFLAFPGKRNDGHQFIAHCYQQGVRNFIISDPSKIPHTPDANFLIVEDMFAALQKWAIHHRNRFNPKVIGITGSNGKTIIKEWLADVFQPHFTVFKNPKSYNSQLGVPLSVLSLKEKHQLAVLEAGISQCGEMEKLAGIIQCQTGILTNLGDAHDAGFSSREEKLREKLLLFKNCREIVYCIDQPGIHRSVGQSLPQLTKVTWTTESNPNAVYRVQTCPENGRSIMQVSSSGETITIPVPFSDRSSIENITHCIITALHFGLTHTDISSAIRLLDKIPLRLELVKGVNDNIIINDSYSFDLHSLNAGLSFMHSQAGQKSKVLVLSDIKEHGESNVYKQLGEIIQNQNLDHLICIGTKIRQLATQMESKIAVEYFPDTNAALKFLSTSVFKNAIFLFKGARIFRFEKLCSAMSEQLHRTTLEIRLNALAHNINTYLRQIRKKTRVMAVVKASAYGSGSVRLVKKLEDLPIDYLAVAYLDEGIFLRKAGIQLPILILNPGMEDLTSLTEYDLEPEVYSLEQLKNLINGLDNALSHSSLGIHLKLDTGMHRLGFQEAKIPELIPLISHPKLKVKSIFSHLAAAEDPSCDDFSLHQIHAFERMVTKIQRTLPYQPLRHILNSSGIIRFPQYQFEMVRLGIGMYGIDPTGTITDQLKKVHRLTSWISQVKWVNPGEAVGYGRHAVQMKRTRLAVVNLGYADGLSKSLGNRNYALSIQGSLCEILGEVCMDVCMIDISRIPPDTPVQEVEIFGDTIPIEKMAKALKTIPYEILCGISSRVKRLYTED